MKRDCLHNSTSTISSLDEYTQVCLYGLFLAGDFSTWALSRSMARLSPIIAGRRQISWRGHYPMGSTRSQPNDNRSVTR